MNDKNTTEPKFTYFNVYSDGSIGITPCDYWNLSDNNNENKKQQGRKKREKEKKWLLKSI